MGMKWAVIRLPVVLVALAAFCYAAAMLVGTLPTGVIA